MTEYDLGPNGAQILAADLLAAQAGDVADQLHALSGELMIVDTPGQVELFAFREASNHLIEVLGRNQSAIIYLFRSNAIKITIRFCLSNVAIQHCGI